MALDGGEDGLDFYRLIANDGCPRLRPGGKVMVEIGDGQAEAIKSVFEAQMCIVESITPDYNGRQRFVTVARPHLVGDARRILHDQTDVTT